MKFEWDDQKNLLNCVKHNVSFALACQVFEDPLHRVKFDRVVDGEERWHALGNVMGRHVLLVVHIYRNIEDQELIRIISARRASAQKGDSMNKSKKMPSIQEQLDALDKMTDKDIDFSDIPEILNWEGAERGKFYRPVKKSVTLRLDADLLAWFKHHHPKYQSGINAALREYVIAHQSKITKLNRFTTLPVLFDMLHRKTLTLLKHDSWSDRNDTQLMDAYKEKKKIKNLYAICMTYELETIYQWKTFSDGLNGCCIQFNAEKLFDIIDNIPGFRHQAVLYKKINELEKSNIQVSDIPFIKRWPYRCEYEYRIIQENNKGNTSDCFDISIPLEIIDKVTISQGMPERIYSTINEHLKNSKIQTINRSTLCENKRWVNFFKNLSA